MLITAESTVADIATHAPATIPVFQRHHIDFCCGGKSPLADVCAERHIDTGCPARRTRGGRHAAERWPVVGGRDADGPRGAHPAPLSRAPAAGVAATRRHARQGREPPWPAPAGSAAAPAGDVSLPAARPARSHAARGRRALPVDRGTRGWQPLPNPQAAQWIGAPIAAMEAEHEQAGGALQTMRELTRRLRATGMGLSDLPRPLLRPVATRGGHARARPPREPHPVPTGRAAGDTARLARRAEARRLQSMLPA